MLNYKLGEHEISIPVSWHEVSVEQFLKLRGEEDNHSVISILTGLAKWLVLSLPDEAINEFLNVLSWLNEPFEFESIPIPQVYNLGGKVISIPQDLTLESAGQKELFEIKASIEDPLMVMDVLLAIYLYPLYTGNSVVEVHKNTEYLIKHSDKLLTEKINGKSIIDHVRESKITEAFPIISFFLSNLKESKRAKSYLATSPKQRNCRQTYQGLTVSEY